MIDVFTGPTTPEPLRAIGKRMVPGGGLAGKLRPWAWWGEVTRGCNLRCGFCATRTFKGEREGEPAFGSYRFMSEQTWRELVNVMNVVSPRTRLEIGQAGEPTLHPQLPDLFRLAREIAPHVQTLCYTNGTTLMSGRRTYQELFESGLNVLYVNMYHPVEKHVALAEKSGYPWVMEGRHLATGEYHQPFAYRADKDPNFRLINFCRNPGNWTTQRRHRHGFYTFLNHLDWRASAKWGLKPLVKPLKRRCDFPSKYPTFDYSGQYLLCCVDFTSETAGQFGGNVSEGPEGFLKFWFGERMQRTRQMLHDKNRAAHPICSRCNCTSHRGDIAWLRPELLDHYWDGTSWQQTRSDVFAAMESHTTASPLQWMAGQKDGNETRAGGIAQVDDDFDDGAPMMVPETSGRLFDADGNAVGDFE